MQTEASRKKLIDEYIKKKQIELEKLGEDDDLTSRNHPTDDIFHDGSKKEEKFNISYFHDEKETDIDKPKNNIVETLISDLSVDTYRKFREMSDFVPDSYVMCYESSEKLEKKTVIKITSTSKTHDHGTNGLFDKRLGPLHEQSKCSTCYMDYHDCDGHSGWITFPEKIPLPTSIEDYENTNRCICWYCFEPFASEEIIKILDLDKFKGSVYRKLLASHSSKLMSLHNHGGYKHENFIGVVSGYLVYTKKGKETKYPKDINIIHKVYSEMSNKNLRILGFCNETHPLAFIMSGIVVVPSRLRAPCVIKDMRQEHYLTMRYYEILKIIAQIEKTSKKDEKQGFIENLYEKVNELINGTVIKGYTKNINAIFNLLSGKEKLIRRNGLGKRVNGSNRTVVGPHRECDIDEIGIPEAICDENYVREPVHMYNMSRIIEEISKGVYVKAMIYAKGKQTIINIKKDTSFVPQIGNILLRKLRDGDLMFTGRQPSLHKSSIVAARVKKHKDKVIRLPASLTGMMNCDFDGDELHTHIPFTSESKIEMALLASVPMNIMNLESNKPMIAPAFHGILYAYYATEKWIRYDELDIIRGKDESQIDYMKRVKASVKDNQKYELEIPERRFPEVIACIKNSHRTRTFIDRCKRHKINHLTGRALLSLSFPVNLTYSNDDLIIVDGILIKGTLKSSNMGKGYGSLVQIICKLFSMSEATRFVSDFTRITDWLTMWASFSCGHQSFSTNRKEIKETLEVKLNKMQTEFYNLGEEPADQFDLFQWKKRSHEIVDESLIYAKNVGNSYLYPNNGLNMLSGNGSGGKGSEMNTSQITAFLGVQKLKGDFQKKELNDKKRILISFLPGDCSLQSMFLIVNSFFDGLSPSEMFAHLCSSREGLLDTAAKTPETGFTRRRIIKSTENVILKYNGQIETTLGKIIDFTYDGLFPGMEVFVNVPEFGKITFFADFKQHADYINGIYDYITEFMPECDPDGNLNPDYEEIDETEDFGFYSSNVNNDDDNGFDDGDNGLELDD